MKKFRLAFFAAIIVAGSFNVPRALALPDLNIVATGCHVAQSTLSQIEKTDTGLRINRGYDYNEILNLMFAMNARLAANKIAAPTLGNLTAEFERDVANFRDHYDQYDDDIGHATKIKCAEKPQDFYDSLEIARISRTVLQNDTEKLNQQIEAYYADLNKITEAES